ncbi:hypothetical protein TIFTF001_027678 [Ficus carica]|uniref:Uncharacterized protein n=1 Tax=Ficus carica TaxID=3494 RepID=A0AA88DHG3_FICCA|nr:hypothetical protein TIFTF001_026007 [Ficus carica]GMN58593.1 hypothetical protein TIFTF001_027678 [Ficus carica]
MILEIMNKRGYTVLDSSYLPQTKERIVKAHMYYATRQKSKFAVMREPSSHGCLSLRYLCNKMGQDLIIILGNEVRLHIASSRDVNQGISHISNTKSGLQSRLTLE